MNARIRHQVGLELGEIDIEGTVETEGSREGRHHLRDETIQVGVGRTFDVEVATAHIVQSLVIQTESAIGVLQQ